MALVCSLCNESPETPVISPLSGHVFEKRLIEKYIAENGTDPISKEPLSVDQLIEVKASNFVKPKAPQATSIPALLKSLQDEWDAVMLYSFTLRQQLQTARLELSHSLYQHDASCRVIARLSKEVAAAREALATLKPQAQLMSAPTTAVSASGDTTQVATVAPSQAPEDVSSTIQAKVVGMGKDVVDQLDSTAKTLTEQRKRRGKSAPEGLVTPDEIKDYREVGSHTGLHESKMPGILSIDVWQKDSSYIVTGGNDRNAVIFDTKNEKNVAILKGHSKKVTKVVYHPSEELVFTSSLDHTVRLWSVPTTQCGQVIYAHSGEVTGLDIHAMGSHLLSCGTDAHWAFSDFRTGQVLSRQPALDKQNNKLTLTCTQFHPDGLLFGTGTHSGDVKIWDIKESKNVATFAHRPAGDSPAPVTSIAFSENGYYLATGGADGVVKLWDLRKLKSIKDLVFSKDRNDYRINDVTFDKSGCYLAVAGSDVQVYQCKQWDKLATFDAHTDMATGVRFTSNCRSLISCGLDRSVKIFGSSS